MIDRDYTALVEQAKAEGFVTVAMFAGIRARGLGLTASDNPFDHAGLRDYWDKGFVNGMDSLIPVAPVVTFTTPCTSHAARTHEFYT